MLINAYATRLYQVKPSTRMGFTGSDDEQRIKVLFEDFKKAENGRLFKEPLEKLRKIVKPYSDDMPKINMGYRYTSCYRAKKVRDEGFKLPFIINNCENLDAGNAIHLFPNKNVWWHNNILLKIKINTDKIAYIAFNEWEKFGENLYEPIFKYTENKQITFDEERALKNELKKELFIDMGYDALYLTGMTAQKNQPQIAVFNPEKLELLEIKKTGI
ncbi:MAG: hypothetical protein A2Y25_07545 [Candidatus Melainabacteria bacterium GWF2_37_15]|nr:MAG: hypothetical protein A2Y25_07545 [Candidatus Melainabacteria bacterium GWF2_37_15]